MTIEELRAMAARLPKTPQGRYEAAVAKLNESADPYHRWCHLGAAAKTALALSLDEGSRARVATTDT